MAAGGVCLNMNTIKDDGFTGTNFQRPAFQRVMHDATDQLDGAERRKIFRFLRSLPNEYSLTVNRTDCT